VGWPPVVYIHYIPSPLKKEDTNCPLYIPHKPGFLAVRTQAVHSELDNPESPLHSSTEIVLLGYWGLCPQPESRTIGCLIVETSSV